MKTLKVILSLCFVGLAFIGCDKSEDDYDFRDAYVGDYKSTYSLECFGSPLCPCEDRIVDTTISVKKGDAQNAILVMGEEVEFNMEEKEFYGGPQRGSVTVDQNGLYFRQRVGGLACYTIEEIQGEK